MNKIFIYIFLYIATASLLIQAQTIHVFGDGHALCFFANEQLRGSYIYTDIKPLLIPVEIHWLGPKTMSEFGHDGLNALDIRSPKDQDIINGQVITKTGKSAQENDILVFVLGAIDVRDHICKQRDLFHRDTDEMVETLVKNYCNTINLNRALYKHLTCVVMEIIPPFNDALYPKEPSLYGSLQDRIAITRLLNSHLKEACLQHNYLFLQTHDLYALKDGSLNPELSDAGCHVAFKHNHLIRRRLVNMLIENDVLT